MTGSLTKDDDIGIKDGGQGDANVVNTLSNTVAKETGNWVSSAGYVQEQFQLTLRRKRGVAETEEQAKEEEGRRYKLG
ncbi:hypothetical protein RHSIM_Rhsim10G0076000 [Rhododendron simsii]|uniref:Uncharacterized protein n=1 Tax=Rhododendron simsii TaxID=118357 RepID=A0A834LDX0_RHOSS|nr:hypothetical protein RHSIM_Rhsim10G0076000 [Rhododendron simsii]